MCKERVNWSISQKNSMPTWCIMLSCDIFDELSHVGDDFSTNCCCTKEMKHTHSGKRQNVVLFIKKISCLFHTMAFFADKTPNNYFSIDQNGNRFFYIKHSIFSSFRPFYWMYLVSIFLKIYFRKKACVVFSSQKTGFYHSSIETGGNGDHKFPTSRGQSYRKTFGNRQV